MHSVASTGIYNVQEHHRPPTARLCIRHRIHVVFQRPHLSEAHQILFRMQPLSDDCHPVTNNPNVHVAALWQNDEAFVLHLYNRRIKKCRDRGSTFKDDRFVIRHRERSMSKRVEKVSTPIFYVYSHPVTTGFVRGIRIAHQQDEHIRAYIDKHSVKVT